MLSLRCGVVALAPKRRKKDRIGQDLHKHE
jgi:hypothetical protein